MLLEKYQPIGGQLSHRILFQFLLLQVRSDVYLHGSISRRLWYLRHTELKSSSEPASLIKFFAALVFFFPFRRTWPSPSTSTDGIASQKGPSLHKSLPAFVP